MTRTQKIAASFVKAQASVTGAKKASNNPHFKSKYADLSECWDACREALKENDIAVMQGVFGDRMKTTLIHSSGETLEDEGVQLCGFAGAKNPMQALGSAITYARRYGLCSMIGISPEDDDGNSLTHDKPAKWHGPLITTKLKAQAVSFGNALETLQTIEDLDTLLNDKDTAAMLKQLEVDLPQWWDWEEERKGAKYSIENKRTELEAKA